MQAAPPRPFAGTRLSVPTFAPEAGRSMAEFARLAGTSNCPVLLLGETGSGKTHLARLIHETGSRAHRPFVRVNCGAIPETLFEREMFGHVRGAFTDAREGGTGFLEEADGGTLFLDEVGELPLSLQPKLLAVLEDGAFRKLGSPRETRVNVHVVAATNCDLREMVARRAFRQDLYYRLSVLQYRVLALRERKSEVPSLITEVLMRHAGGGAAPQVTPEAAALLQAYPWPGNIREMENVLRAALVFARGEPLAPEHLPREVREAEPAARYASPGEPEEEAGIIRQALAQANGNKTHAARALGMSRSTLWAKLQRYEG